MIALDQIDAIVTEANLRAGSSPDATDDNERKARSIIETLTGGLIDLFDVSSRSLLVAACLQATWNVFQQKASNAFQHRFLSPTPLESLQGKDRIAKLIGRRLHAAFENEGFVAPYATWPFRPEAIASAENLSPRLILMRCDEFRLRSMTEGKVSECRSLAEIVTGPSPVSTDGLLDAAFEEFMRIAKIDGLVDESDDGKALGGLMRETLAIYCKEIEVPEDVDVIVASDLQETRPTLHARLTFTYHSENDREQHFCFRIIQHANARSIQPRLRAAMTAAGIDHKLKFRHLFVLRNFPLPKGKVTEELCKKFTEDGGKFIAPMREELRVFVALRDMQAQNPEGFESWLRARKPLCATTFFKEIGLCSPPLDPCPSSTDGGSEAGKTSPTAPTDAMKNDVPVAEAPHPAESTTQQGGQAATSSQSAASSASAFSFSIGRRIEGGGDGRLESMRAELLPRHTAIFAGAGSGKTVLLRRIVEEAALLGIPAIVLDTNNDLARLGESWPESPSGFTDDDKEKARFYKEQVEVVIWTPGLAHGRPLALSLLPNFASLDDPAERSQAVDMARVTLKPLIGAAGAKGTLKEGVLADALHAFSMQENGGLESFIAFLADLPEGVSRIGNNRKLAQEISDQLKAKMAVNPLLQTAGQSVDPDVLFNARMPGKTRISIINFCGLLANDLRQDFVNQLQMALFTWIRNHPSPTGRLYVMDEAQNFAPSQVASASKASAMALAAQARKYGLGMIFATQLPKGIENGIVSNCTTHFYGRMSSPATIEATKDMMAAKGGAAEDLGRLERGIFYFSTEGVSRPVKIRTPLCLSFHPQNPLTPEEIVVRARR
jgi:hypothetical protein